eukprot:13694978-Alexandrium_andersonii.AAC.1
MPTLVQAIATGENVAEWKDRTNGGLNGFVFHNIYHCPGNVTGTDEWLERKSVARLFEQISRRIPS